MKSYLHPFCFEAHRAFRHLWVVFVLLSSSLFGQGEIGLAGRGMEALRLNMVRPQGLRLHEQRPPYEWSGAYLQNAFDPPSADDEVFLLDSSLCGNGVAGTDEYTQHLKARYTYDDHQFLTKVEYRQSISGGPYERFSQKLYAYEDGQRTSYLYQVWNANTQDWENEYEERTFYNAQGLWERFLAREVGENGRWRPLQVRRLTYNAAGLPKNFQDSLWSNGGWLPVQRTEATYNDAGFLKQVITQDWNGADWGRTYRETMNYDPEGFNWRGYLLEERPDGSNEFMDKARELYRYDLYGFWTGTIRQEMNEQQEWENVFWEEYDYTRRGIWIGWSKKIWEAGEWVNDIRQRYQKVGDFRVDRVQTWDAGSNDWVNAYRNLTKFDENGNLVQEIGTQMWDAASGEWVLLEETRQCTHEFSAFRTTNIDRPVRPSLDCSISNPYRLHTPIQCHSLEGGKTYEVNMIDMQGRSVYQTQIQGHQGFSVNRPLTRGLYNLQIFHKGRLQHTQKLIVTP